MSAGLEVEGLVWSPRGRELLRGVSFAAEPGRLTALLGPSGAGKTSTLRLIAGLERPQAGRISIGGRVVNDVPTPRREVGLVHQSYALWPHLTVFENLAFPLRVRRRPAAEIAERVARMLGLLRLEGVGERKPGSLSGGEQQRVALGRSLIYDPAVLLLDEPLANVDPPNRQAIGVELRELLERAGATAVYVTHDHAEARALADSIVVLHEGRAAQQGAPREVFERPANPAVAAFLRPWP